MKQMIISQAPHIHADISTRRLMRDVLIALSPTVALSVAFYGWAELCVLFASVASCVLFEWVISRYLLRRGSSIGDLSAAVTGVLLALNLPPQIPIWLVIVGALVAIGVAKMSFGGLGQNVFNPALVARVFLLVSAPAVMTTWTVPDINAAWVPSVDAVSGPTLLSLIKQGEVSSVDLLSPQGGSAGEIFVLALIAGFAYLLIRRVIKPWITLSIWATVLIFAAVMHIVDPQTYPAALTALCTGGLMLGSIFMATDYVTSPMTSKGGVIFGIGIGILTLVIRYWGAYPEGVSFAILLMNACVPLINKCCRSKKFGRA